MIEDMLTSPIFWVSTINGMFCWWLGYAYAKRERN